MNKLDYQQEMEKILKSIQNNPKRLLLHSCCAPCSSYCLELLSPYFNIDIFFYNPNIDTLSEFNKRLKEQKEIIKDMHLNNINIIEVGYNEHEYLESIKGYENQLEGGLRCKICYDLRMRKAAKYAKAHGYDYFTTTLSVSPHKNVQWINEIGLLLSSEFGIGFLQSDFKKKGGFIRSIELSKKYNLYRQNYCGCVFSKR